MKNKLLKNIIPIIPLILTLILMKEENFLVKFLLGMFLSVAFYSILFNLGFYSNKEN